MISIYRYKISKISYRINMDFLKISTSLMFATILCCYPLFQYRSGYFKSFVSLIRSLQKINKLTSIKKTLFYVTTYFLTSLPYLARQFSCQLMSLLMPAAYCAESFFSTVYHFKVCRLYLFVSPSISVPIGSKLIL